MPYQKKKKISPDISEQANEYYAHANLSVVGFFPISISRLLIISIFAGSENEIINHEPTNIFPDIFTENFSARNIEFFDFVGTAYVVGRLGGHMVRGC